MGFFYSMNVEPGRKEQGSRCWRCWTRPLGSRCPRSYLSSSPTQDIVQKWDIEAVSRRLLARSHPNVLHLDTLHLFFPPTCMFCKLSLLSSLLSRFASWSQKSPELLYKKKKSKIAKIPERTKTRMSQLQKCSQSISPE